MTRRGLTLLLLLATSGCSHHPDVCIAFVCNRVAVDKTDRAEAEKARPSIAGQVLAGIGAALAGRNGRP